MADEDLLVSENNMPDIDKDQILANIFEDLDDVNEGRIALLGTWEDQEEIASTNT